VYCNLGITPLWIIILLNVVLFVSISSRMISASALMTAVPAARDRGAYMGINSSIQQLSGGVASAVAGMIVVQAPDGRLLHYDVLGYVVAGAMLLTIAMMYMIHRMVNLHQPATQPQPVDIAS
jgi:MFS family permease